MTGADWREVYESAFPQLYRALVALGARPDEAEDALQDAFVKGMEARRPIGRPSAWLFVVASRAWRNRRVRERLLRPLLPAAATSDPPDPEAAALLAEVARLSRRQREVFVARYVLGLSQEETAQALGMARGTVSSTTTQVAAVLRQRLGWTR